MFDRSSRRFWLLFLALALGLPFVLDLIEGKPADLQEAIRWAQLRKYSQREKGLKRIREASPEDWQDIPNLIRASELHAPGAQDAIHQALTQIGPPRKEQIPELIELLEADSVRMNWYAARALGQLGKDAEAAVPALIEALKKNESDYGLEKGVAEVAAESLIQIGAAAVPELLKCLEVDHSDHFHMLVRHALLQIGEPALPGLMEQFARDWRRSGFQMIDLLSRY